jgi:hypothetical protein
MCARGVSTEQGGGPRTRDRGRDKRIMPRRRVGVTSQRDQLRSSRESRIHQPPQCNGPECRPVKSARYGAARKSVRAFAEQRRLDPRAQLPLSEKATEIAAYAETAAQPGLPKRCGTST